MSDKELAIACKHAVIVGNVMFIISPVKGKVELIKSEVVPVFSVPFCLFYFAYQSRIHCIVLLF